MLSLSVVSILWAFSFGIINRTLAGLDAQAVAWVRLVISLVVFLPFLRSSKSSLRDRVHLAFIGAIQYGIMYVAYIEAFRKLAGHEVALFTITTPLWVTLINDWQCSKFQRGYWAATILAVGGAALITDRQQWASEMMPGFLLIQMSNLCFAAGQVEYRRFCKQRGLNTRDLGMHHFVFLYLGAVLVTSLLAIPVLSSFRPSSTQWLALVYLGVIPSALGLFLWNRGARQVNAGVLAVFNNVKIPLAVLVSLLVFRETVSWWRLVGGVVVIGAGFMLASGVRKLGPVISRLKKAQE